MAMVEITCLPTVYRRTSNATVAIVVMIVMAIIRFAGEIMTMNLVDLKRVEQKKEMKKSSRSCPEAGLNQASVRFVLSCRNNYVDITSLLR